MKTPFMWAGSKDRYYKVIKSYIPDFDHYQEPFLGSGAIYFRLLADRGIFNGHCSDVNESLISTYEIIRDDPQYLIANLPKTKDKTIFQNFLKTTTNTKRDEAVRFLYLNRNRFFGMGGWMNADRYALSAVVDRINFFSPLMKNTEFSKSCWDCKFPQNTFTFCDPPYPETNNLACYKISDVEIMDLNKKYFEHVVRQNQKFFWVTKYSDEFNNFCTTFSNISVEKREWGFRKPGMGVQESHEIYVSNCSPTDNFLPFN